MVTNFNTNEHPQLTASNKEYTITTTPLAKNQFTVRWWERVPVILSARQGHVCKEWDAELNMLLDEHEIVPVSLSGSDKTVYTILLGDIEVWVGNYPYSFGYHCPRRSCFSDRLTLPSSKTIIRLRKALEANQLTIRTLYCYLP